MKISFVTVMTALLLASVGCKSTTADPSGHAFIGKWVAVSSTHPEANEEVLTAELILDSDDYALAKAVEKDYEEAEDGTEYAVPDETYAIEGKWTQPTDQRIEASFVIEDQTIRLIGFLNGSNKMSATIIYEEIEAIEVEAIRETP